MKDTTEEWLSMIGSKEARDERVRLRLAGSLNALIRGPKGLDKAAANLSGLRTTAGHPWSCECDICRPWLWVNGKKIATDREPR